MSHLKRLCYRNAGGSLNGTTPEVLHKRKTLEKKSEKGKCKTEVNHALSTCVSNILVTCTSSENNKAFIAGNIRNYINQWEQLTSDNTIVATVNGYKIDLFWLLVRPSQLRVPVALKCSPLEITNMDLQIPTFLKKGIIVKSSYETEQFISTVFLREKNDGTFRMILNLKVFNKWVNYNHFKMDSIHTCTSLMKPGCYMGSIDLKGTYLSIPIHRDHQKYLAFYWKKHTL